MRSGPVRFLRSLALALLGLGAMAGLFIAAATLLPTVALDQSELHSRLPDWITLVIQNGTADYLIDLCYVIASLLVITFIVSLLPVPLKARCFAERALFVISWTGTALTVYLLVASCVGLRVTSGDLDIRQGYYNRALSHFGLLEEANGRFDKVQSYLNQMGSAKLVKIKDASELNDRERQEQIGSLLDALRDTEDVSLLKQVLTRSDYFRTWIAKSPTEVKLVLKAAALCGAPADNIDNFYNWLEPKIGTDGWTQMPLYVLRFSQ